MHWARHINFKKGYFLRKYFSFHRLHSLFSVVFPGGKPSRIAGRFQSNWLAELEWPD